MKRTVIVLLASLAAFGIAVSAAVAAASPSVVTGVASSVRNTTANLNGSVNPNGSRTTYFFVSGPTTAYGGSSLHHNAGNGTRFVGVRVTARGLLPGTVYHYKLIAQNANGTTSGADRTFKTTGHAAPGVVTGFPVNISAFGATFTGTVIPNGQATSWTFQFSGGGPFVTSSGGAVAAGSGPTNVSQVASPLVPGTTYQYRLLGTHAGFPTSYGAFATFSTFPTVRPYPPKFTASTKPSRDRTKPFTFTTTGSLVPSSKFAQAAQCSGTAAVRYFIGNRQVSLSQATILPNCTYSSTVAFTHTFAFKIGGKRPSTEQLRVEVRFGGNGWLAPTAKARVGHVTLG